MSSAGGSALCAASACAMNSAKRILNSAITRRRMLGAALGGLSVPLLWRYQNFLSERQAFAQESGGPKRLIVFWNPQGLCSDLDPTYAPLGLNPLWPEGNAASFELGYDPLLPTTGRILAPLARHKQDLLLLRGFNLPTGAQHRDVCGHESADGAHGFGSMAALTAACTFTTDGEAQFGGGPSIDQYVAEHIGLETARPSMVLTCGGTKANHRGFVSYSGANAPVVPMDVETAYYSAFGNAVGATDTRLAELRLRRASALDLIRDDAARIQRRLPPTERAKMEAHLEAFRLLERDLDRTLMCDGGELVDPGSHFPGHFAQQAKTVAAAVACDISRVFCIMASSAGGDTSGDLRYFDPEWPTNYHSTGHASGGSSDGGGEDVETRRHSYEMMIRVGEFYAQWVAELIDALKAIPEGTGTAFDNTLFVWATEMSHGNHGNHQWPWFVAGGKWHFTNNYYWNQIAADKYSQEHAFGDLLTAIAQAMDVPTPRFGHEGFSNGNPDSYSALWRYNA